MDPRTTIFLLTGDPAGRRDREAERWRTAPDAAPLPDDDPSGAGAGSGESRGGALRPVFGRLSQWVGDAWRSFAIGRDEETDAARSGPSGA